MRPLRQTIELPAPDATDALGTRLAAALPADGRLTVFLAGDLGAGKTSLIRALLRALGVQGPVRSPTYSIVERHALADGSYCAHFDLYRIADAEELEFLGLDELSVECRLWCVEWADRFTGALPPPDLTIALRRSGEGRQAELFVHSDAAQCWVDQLGSFRPADFDV